MTRQQLVHHIREKESFLCVGLDPDPARIPASYGGDLLRFNQDIIDATRDSCVAYKPNTAFYEALGLEGINLLRDTIAYIGDQHLVIADAKRGDIGNTSRYYARFAFETLGADAITVAPYMGADSVQPFLEYTGKWTILLALTSNPGSHDFQHTPQEDGPPLFAKVMRRAAEWGTPDQLMFVCGATQAERFTELRRHAPQHFFLVPGIGAQGGDLEGVCRHGMTDEAGLLVNSSRGIIYADDPGSAARELQEEMGRLLNKYAPGLFQ
ncbi:orotidine-5'-phosphate decarboxylase [Lewinella marina]|uniref:Orotidine-5'-phosphate decarboxylase n=1 Tax=Neolewinella marina TaxID=438751 RepID=A0A2G0CHV8_9BACT|nr:orotidine-5'-phosphate decarboxylase [Neolewinella marina]NJB85323.1 orotidine-5'-phosphate decarboxylase [Neolewinella marina]PHK99561.1 orotidine-5'-phosphate decarboxylase [Neolewinella marina]